MTESDKSFTKDGVKKITELLVNNSSAVAGFASTALIAGMNQLVEHVSFKCPCLSEGETNTADTNRREEYGYLFIFGPALFLLFIVIIVNINFWKQITDTCLCRCESCSDCCKKIKFCKCTRLFSCQTSFTLAFFYGFGAFLVWILISLVDGDFIACAHSKCVGRNFTVDECQCVSSVFSKIFIFY